MAICLSGDPAIVPETGELDLDLEARLMGPRIDVGADEVTPPGCVYAVTPSGAAFLRQGGSGTVTVEAPAGCGWTPVSLDEWITVTEEMGDGNGSATYSVSSSDAGPFSRAGTLLVATRQVSVTQLGSLSMPIVMITEPTNGPLWTTPLDDVDPAGNRAGRHGAGVGRLGKRPRRDRRGNRHADLSREGVGEDLQGDVAAELGVVGTAHFPDATLSNEGHDIVMSKPRTDRDSHRSVYRVV